MLGMCLLFVEIILINNGMCALYHVDGRSAAVQPERDCCSALRTFLLRSISF